MVNIYIFDKNIEHVKELIFYFEQHNFNAKYFSNIDSFLSNAKEEYPDFIVIDPFEDILSGLELIKYINKNLNIRFLIYSKEESEMTKIYSFELGAEDYISKSQNQYEVFLRCKNITKNFHFFDPSFCCWIFKDHIFKFDTEQRKFYLDNELISLTKSQWEILFFLCNNAGIGFSRKKISEKCLQLKSNTYKRTIDNHIKSIRSKIHVKNFICTIRSFGYKFVGKRLIGRINTNNTQQSQNLHTKNTYIT